MPNTDQALPKRYILSLTAKEVEALLLVTAIGKTALINPADLGAAILHSLMHSVLLTDAPFNSLGRAVAVLSSQLPGHEHMQGFVQEEIRKANSNA